MPRALERGEVLLLDVRRGRLEDDLELLVLVEAVRVLAVAPVGGAPRGLHVADLPRPRAEHAEERLRVHGAGAHLGVPGLVDEAAPLRPEALEGEDDLLERHRTRLPCDLADHPRGPEVPLEVRRDEVAVERLDRARRRARLAERVGRAAEELGQQAPRVGRQVRAGGRPAVGADEAVGGAVVGERPRRRQRPAAGGAAVERRVEPVQLQQPGLQVAAQELGARALLGGLHDGERQAVDPLLGLALGREGVEQLRAAREEERRLEAARAGPEGRVQELRLPEPEELRTLPAVERHPHLGERLQGRLVSRLGRPAPRGPPRAPFPAPA